MVNDTLATPEKLKKKRDALKAKRDSLFDEYMKHPNDYRFAREIKTIDDEIAECTEKEKKFSAPRKALSNLSR
jgi:hypothetical protein